MPGRLVETGVTPPGCSGASRAFRSDAWPFANAPCSVCFSSSVRRRPPPPTEAYSQTRLTEEGRSIGHIAFSPDGTKIVLALDDASVRLKDTAGGEGTLLKWEGQPAYFVAFSPDGARIVTGSSRRWHVRIWDVASGGRIAQFTRPGEQLYNAAFSPDGSRIVIGTGRRHCAHPGSRHSQGDRGARGA